jgi:hypothetical protein
VAQRAYDLSVYLSAVAARVEGRPGPALPRLADVSAGDQVAVVGHDVVAALRVVYVRLDRDDSLRDRADDRELVDRMLVDAVRALKDFRREV